MEKRKLGICRQGGIELTPGKIQGQIINNLFLRFSSIISRKETDNTDLSRADHIRPNSLASLTEYAGFVECGEAVYVIQLDLYKAFEILYHGILLHESGKQSHN